MKQEKEIIYFITGNNHKFNEIKKLFQKEELVYDLKQKTAATIEIQASSIKEVALFKLNSVNFLFSNSYFVEDAGFFIDVPLKGFPGVYSKFVLNTIGNKGILKLITDYWSTAAHFEAVIALYFQPLDKIFIFEGSVEGKVSKEIRGTSGFGYDPIFIPNELPNTTFAELSTEEKNSISHRAKAWQKLLSFLREHQ
ncbi:MAG: RdgB/HAM1 family non-canonical purine NTP pyrophosphatase [Candidatus Lokiarchaeota archaeon]|nr:RdgB/HAM1 family non-canonical purine NTP pyrophosphatase [Candidatus Lokiarchaeota archaeon]